MTTNAQPQSEAQPGVSKIVKLGDETLLITQIENAGQLEEGAIEIRSIEAVPVPTDPGGAALACFIQTICGQQTGGGGAI